MAASTASEKWVSISSPAMSLSVNSFAARHAASRVRRPPAACAPTWPRTSWPRSSVSPAEAACKVAPTAASFGVAPRLTKEPYDSGYWYAAMPPRMNAGTAASAPAAPSAREPTASFALRGTEATPCAAKRRKSPEKSPSAVLILSLSAASCWFSVSSRMPRANGVRDGSAVAIIFWSPLSHIWLCNGTSSLNPTSRTCPAVRAAWVIAFAPSPSSTGDCSKAASCRRAAMASSGVSPSSLALSRAGGTARMSRRSRTLRMARCASDAARKPSLRRMAWVTASSRLSPARSPIA